jgi:hypothetical protein
MRARPTAAGALAVLAIALAACGSGNGGSGSGNGGRSGAAHVPAAPEGSFCQVVLAWSNAGVGTVNHFSLASPKAADVAARRQLYVQAWDGLGAISTWVDTAADRAPDAVQTSLHRAADEVRDTIATGKDAADHLPDAAYEYASVQDGTLFTSNEKSRAVVYRALDNLRGTLGEQVVPVACGRQTEPVTLPVVTPP